MTHLIVEGKAVCVVYLDFSRAFNAVSHSILETLAADGLDKYRTSWTDRLRVVVNGV